MPSRAKMRMKRKSRNKSEMMERMLFSNEITRFLSDGQYLQTNTHTTAESHFTNVVKTCLLLLYGLMLPKASAVLGGEVA